MIKVYDKNEQRFVTNGLVVLDSCKSLFITEELNGQYELEMEYPIDARGKWKYLVQDNIIEADGQLFRIYHPNKTDFNTIKINARHVFYDLLDNLVEDIDIRGLSGAAALEKVMSHLAYITGFTWMSDITATNNIYIDDESGDITGKNPIDAIMFLLNTYSGELMRDNFNIKFLKARGQDRGMLISYGKNIKGITEDTNVDSVITRIKPIGKDGLYLPEEFIDSPYVGDYAHPKIAQIEFSDCNDYDSLRQASKDYFADNKCDIPQINYKVDFVELRKTEEYKNYAVLESVYLGDTVTVRVKKLGIDVKCEVIKIKKNILTDRIEEIELGNFKKNIAESINKAQQVADVFGGAIANGKLTKSFLQSWVDNATDLIIKSNGGHVVQDENGINIMDTTDKATAQKVWRWNLGGLGFSSTGYNGPFGLALTSDGAIVADRITAGELNGAILKANTVKTSALEVNAQQVINTTVPSLQTDVGGLKTTVNGLSSDNNTNKQNIITLQTQIQAVPGQIDSKVSASATSTLSSANSYTDNQVSPVRTTANNANSTANTLRDTTIPTLADRMTSAEQKITPDAIVETVSDSTTYYKDTLLPTVVNLATTRAGAVINPLQAYNFTGGTAIGNNTLVTMQSGQNEYTPSLDGLEIYGATAVTFDRQVDRVQDAEATISEQANDISLVVKDHAVDGSSLVSAINMSGSKISASAVNIDLTGYVTFNALSAVGSTTINGANIQTGTISADKISGGTISGALLRTSNTSNYMMLHEQYLDVYYNNVKEISIGYFPLSGTSQNVPAIEFPNGNIHSYANYGLNIYSNDRISMTAANALYLSASNTIDLSATNVTLNGAAIATMPWVTNQNYATQAWVQSFNYLTSGSLTGYATQSWVNQQGFASSSSTISKSGNYIYLPNGMYIYADGSNMYFYDSSGNKIFGFNSASCAGVVPGYGYHQLAAS